MKTYFTLFCLLALPACQSFQADPSLTQCESAKTAELIKACQVKQAEELQNLRQDIRKNRRVRNR